MRYQPSFARNNFLKDPQNNLAIAVFVLVGLAAIGAAILPSGMPIFDKLLPALMFVLGYFFPQR